LCEYHHLNQRKFCQTLTAKSARNFTKNAKLPSSPKAPIIKIKQMTENELSNKIIGLAIEVHTALGRGLPESAYKACLYYKIGKAGIWIEKEKPIPLIFEEVKLDCGCRIDLVAENKLVIETKSVEAINDIHLAQTLTYLKLGNYKLGLLINFNVLRLKDGIKRVVNKL